MKTLTYRKDLRGKRFNKLVPFEFSHLNKTRHAMWKCKCDCGNETIAESRLLINGTKKSCGCLVNNNGRQSKTWKGYEDISLSFFHKIRFDAIKRKLPFEVTIEQCWNLFITQNRKCKLSGLPIQFQTKVKTFDGTASLDRIDSSRGYTIDNIQWVHKDVNTMKWDLTPERFLFLVEKINETSICGVLV